MQPVQSPPKAGFLSSCSISQINYDKIRRYEHVYMYMRINYKRTHSVHIVCSVQLLYICIVDGDSWQNSCVKQTKQIQFKGEEIKASFSTFISKRKYCITP
jgi:hypothetical protein